MDRLREQIPIGLNEVELSAICLWNRSSSWKRGSLGRVTLRISWLNKIWVFSICHKRNYYWYTVQEIKFFLWGICLCYSSFKCILCNMPADITKFALCLKYNCTSTVLRCAGSIMIIMLMVWNIHIHIWSLALTAQCFELAADKKVMIYL